jgi:hypothetical protein
MVPSKEVSLPFKQVFNSAAFAGSLALCAVFVSAAAAGATGTAVAALGKAVQVDTIKPTLKAPGTGRLKLKYAELLSSSAFNIHLRRYSSEASLRSAPSWGSTPRWPSAAGAYTRSHFRLTSAYFAPFRST